MSDPFGHARFSIFFITQDGEETTDDQFGQGGAFGIGQELPVGLVLQIFGQNMIDQGQGGLFNVNMQNSSEQFRLFVQVV